MAQRNDNECAYCAEQIEPQKTIVGKDWKVYCSLSCAQAGETISNKEFDQLMRRANHANNANSSRRLAGPPRK